MTNAFGRLGSSVAAVVVEAGAVDSAHLAQHQHLPGAGEEGEVKEVFGRDETSSAAAVVVVVVVAAAAASGAWRLRWERCHTGKRKSYSGHSLEGKINNTRISLISQKKSQIFRHADFFLFPPGGVIPRPGPY